MKEKASISLVRHINSEIVLTYLQRHPNATIPEMSRETKLSLPTVTRTINSALAIGLIEMTERKGEEKGRKAQCYAFNDAYGCGLFMVVKEHRILVQVVSVSGRILHRTQLYLQQEDILNILHSAIQKQLAQFSNLKYVCITLSGHIRDGYIYASNAYPKLNGVNLETLFESTYHIRVMVMDSVKILPYSGRLYDPDFRKKVVLYLSFEIEDGCGSAVSVRGKTYPGTTGGFGELYFLPLPINRMSRQQKYIRFAQAMVGIINADSVVLYGDESVDFKKIIDKIKEVIPDYAMPEFRIARGLVHDNFQSMKILAFDYVLDSIEKGEH